mmetsp:Transcript_12308/g.31965  ORF Transcript_12308/g.31965 Transcript_12308/m.31965 type:complete len:290 (-) Transcript_12308:415-1284(-)
MHRTNEEHVRVLQSRPFRASHRPARRRAGGCGNRQECRADPSGRRQRLVGGSPGQPLAARALPSLTSIIARIVAYTVRALRRHGAPGGRWRPPLPPPSQQRAEGRRTRAGLADQGAHQGRALVFDECARWERAVRHQRRLGAACRTHGRRVVACDLGQHLAADVLHRHAIAVRPHRRYDRTRRARHDKLATLRWRQLQCAQQASLDQRQGAAAVEQDARQRCGLELPHRISCGQRLHAALTDGAVAIAPRAALAAAGAVTHDEAGRAGLPPLRRRRRSATRGARALTRR